MIARLEAIKKLLLEDWDPIGIAGVSGADDEYDNYAMPVLVMMTEGKHVEALAGYLDWIVTERMGLSGNRDHDRFIAAKLLALRGHYRDIE